MDGTDTSLISFIPMAASYLHMVFGAVAIGSVPLQLPLPDRVRGSVVGFSEHLPEVEGTHVVVISFSPPVVLVAVRGRWWRFLVAGVGTKHLAEVRCRLHVGGGGGAASLAVEEDKCVKDKGEERKKKEK